jgi:polyhydroxyalkanoate synthesis repressor PhaR
MPIIKRYPNRKLYDTEAKQYITLDRIAEMIRDNIEVQVTDYATGEDVTALTLTQIIFEQEKKHNNFLPSTLLANLIQAGGDRLTTLQHVLSTRSNLWHHIDEEIRSRIQELVKKGELNEDFARRLTERLTSGSRNSGENWQAVEEVVQNAISARGLPSQDDFQQLIQQLENLETKLNKLQDKNT